MEVDKALEEVGQFGLYQARSYLLLIFPLAFSAYYSISYVFSAGDLTYRCYVPECEDPGGSYFTPWLHNAVPFTDRKPAPCLRYVSANSSCSQFTKETTTCEQYVFESDHTSIVTSFGIYCPENKWKLTMVGTLNNVGQFLGLPMVGYISDRFGRKVTFIWSLLLSTFAGVAKSFSPSYSVFVFLESLDAVVAEAIYSGGFILGAELVGPKRRVLTSSILSSAYTLGEVILGLVAWFVFDWRTVLRVLYAPGILFIFYFWLIPESLRWLHTKGKNEKVISILEDISVVNGKTLSKETKDKLLQTGPVISEKTADKIEEEEAPMKEILHEPKILLRVANCSFSWITHTIVFYGLSLNSVSIAGNQYLNFILISIAELPGYFIAAIIMDSLGRRVSLSGCLLVSGTSCILFHFVPKDIEWICQLLFFLGKCAITASFTVLYMFTAEMFPTNLRHSLMGTCSMFGRIGSMLAPQAPLLRVYMDPVLLFGGIASCAGLLALFFPETYNKPLPDTIKQANNIDS